MSKLEKFILNPDTLLFEIRDSSEHRLRKILIVVVGGVLLFALYFLIYLYVFGLDLPKTAILKRQNAHWASKMEQMSTRIDLTQELLEDLAIRDDRIYRSVYGLDEIPPSLRRNTGGMERHKELEKLGRESELVAVTLRLDELCRMASVQSKSFDEVLALAKIAGDRASHIPAIPPMSTDPSSYHMSSPFGYRSDPLYGYAKMHTGMDFACPPGNPIYATGDGVVTKVAHENNGYGNHVEITHGFGYMTRYAHMKAIWVEEGDTLRRGDCIGESGRSGRITGPHLHYEVHYRKDYVNPANYMDLTIPVRDYFEMVRKPSEKQLRNEGEES